MTGEQLYGWMSDFRTMDQESIGHLKDLAVQYPYFQAAQTLLAKNLKQENHIDQLRQLQIAAIHSPDRRQLYNYMHELVPSEVKLVKMPVADEIEERAEPLHEEPEHLLPDELIPEPVIYQLETAVLTNVPLEKPAIHKNDPEPAEMTFSEWLTSIGNEQDAKATPAKADAGKGPTVKKANLDLIDHFLKQPDRKMGQRTEFFNPQKAAARSTAQDFTVISETLADIYGQQGKYELARKAYHALSLKYPDKNAYFAARSKQMAEKLNPDN